MISFNRLALVLERIGSRVRLAVAVVIVAAFGGSRSLAVPSFIPAGDSVVLERLPMKQADEAARQLRDLRRAQQANSTDLPAALALGHALLSRAASEADPRYLGQAQAALAPWWDSPAAPASVLILRGGIEQSRHEFEPAIATLKRAVRLEPRAPQGWLTLASVYMVRGRYAEARSCCFRLASLSDELTLAGATAGVTSMTGGAQQALSMLEAVLQKVSGSIDADLAARRLWCETLAGEIAERLGRTEIAEAHYRNALRLRPTDPYTLAALADFLLEAGRNREVIQLLGASRRCDGLLQRYAEACVRADGAASAEAKEAIESLALRFQALALRGERVHLREEARFRLRLLHEAEAAQKLAVENWGVQKEAADVRLLLETSRAAKNPEGVQMALDWVRTNRLEDAVFQRQTSDQMASQ